MSTLIENRAARLLQAHLRRHRLSLEAFLNLLADHGVVLSRDQFNNYLRPLSPPNQPTKRRNRGFPQDPALLEAIVRIFAEYGPRELRWGPYQALEFALAANQDRASLRQLAALFPDRAAFDAAYREVVGPAGHAAQAAAAEAIDRIPTHRVPHHAPFTVPTYGEFLAAQVALVGRDEVLTWLAHTTKHEPSLRLVITGMPGLGKTTLLSEFALRYGNYFQGGAFLLRADTLDLLHNELLDLGVAHFGLGVYANQSEAFRLDQVRAALQSALPCLLIIDNIDTLRSEEIAALLPPSGACRIIMTSRARATYLAWQQHELAHLERATSCALLAHAIGNPAATTDPALARHLDRLATLLGDLPLMLTLVGALLRVRRNAIPQALAEILAALEAAEPHQAIGQLAPEALASAAVSERLLGYVLAQLDPARTPHATPGRELLALAALFPPGQPIRRETLGALATTSKATAEGAWQPIPYLETTLNLLSDLAILSRQPGGFYSLHRLVRSYLREHLPLRPALLRTAEWLCTHLMAEQGEAVDGIRAHEDLLRSLTEDAQQHQIARATTLAQILAYYDTRASKFASALYWAKAALTAAEARYGHEHKETTEAWCRLGLAHMFRAEFPASIAALSRAMELTTRVYEADHIEHLVAMSNLAQIYVIFGRVAESRRYARRVIRHAKRMMPTAEDPAKLHLRITRVLRMLGQGRLDQGFPRHSLNYFLTARKAVADETTIAAVLDGETAASLLLLGEYERVEFFHRRAEAQFRALYRQSIDEEGVLWQLNGSDQLKGFAWLALMRQQFERAEELRRQAEPIIESTVGQSSLEYCGNLILKSEIALQAGQLAAAEAPMSQIEAQALALYQSPWSFIGVASHLRRARLALLRDDRQAVESHLTTVIAAVNAGHCPNRLLGALAQTLQVELWRRRGEHAAAAAQWAWLAPRLRHRLGNANPRLNQLAAQGPLPLIDPASFFFGAGHGY